jgi:hypothetical protein
MKYYVVAGVADMVVAGGLIAAAPPASAGCQNAGWLDRPLAQMCDGPVQPDGTWQRCVKYYAALMIGGRPLDLPRNTCYSMGPDQAPPPHGWIDQATHIDNPMS